MQTNYIFIDTETCGTDPQKNDLLSIALVVWSKTKGIIDSKDFFIKYSDYNLTEESRLITNFNETAHNLKAIPGKDVAKQIMTFLCQHFDLNYKITIIGHNVSFDISFLKVFFAKSGITFDNIFSHRSIDTYSIYKSLILAGKIDKDIESSTEAFNYFNINIAERHTAMGDCLATVELFENLLLLMK